jgi:Reverse transcriptase (RNA-dependent DNA polymerase)
MARLSDRDARRWHALAGRIVPEVERSLPGNVLANRAFGGAAGWVLEPVGPALRRARHAGEALAGAPLLLRTDVAAFYASVSPAVVVSTLRALGVEPDAARVTAEMLEGWGADEYPGLPIGPPGSAVMANAVLAPVDAALDRYRSLRWVDDYLVAVSSERDAEEALERIDHALAGLGLVRSEPKTRIASELGTWLAGRSASIGA